MRSRRLLVGVAVLLAVTFIASGGYANHGMFYVLDGFGGVHAGGGAPVISPGTPYFGFDIAKDIIYVPQGTAISAGDSVLVLDGFGGVHEGGAIAADPVAPKTPYFGFNIARAIAYRNIPPRVGGTSNTAFIDINDNLVHAIASVTLFAPDDGFVVVQGSVQINCPSNAAGDLIGQVGLNIDSATTIDVDFDGVLATIRDCNDLVGGSTFPAQHFAPIKTYAVSAGAHTFHLLVRRVAASGTNPLRHLDPKLTAIFVDQDTSGLSASDMPVRPTSNGAGIGGGQ